MVRGNAWLAERFDIGRHGRSLLLETTSYLFLFTAVRLEEDAAGRLPAAFFDGPEFASAADFRFMSGPEDDDAAAVEPVARPLEEAEGGIGG